ncbi:hypothetical protein ACOSP7_022673 [Xanthoceras sorbifolium]
MVILQLLHTGPTPVGLFSQLLSELRLAGNLVLAILSILLCSLKLPAKPFELLVMFFSLFCMLLSLTLIFEQILVCEKGEL